MSGGVAERPNAPVLKTGDTKVSVGSNPTPSAKFYNHYTSTACRTVKKLLKKLSIVSENVTLKVVNQSVKMSPLGS